ncbi:MAG: hypothetical protein HY901_09220 [Deltaproteobacteria bacterium]|nr:hypothetical protein [Deltaproteobacteria bacterium]
MSSPVRTLGLGLLALTLLSGCGSCVDEPARPVTLRVVNKLGWDIFVRDEAGQLGLTVQQDADGTWEDLQELAACDCQECSEACSGCVCGVETWARRVRAGARLERTWSGEYRSNEKVSCFLGETKPCLGERRAAQPTTYRLELCWASSVANAPDDSERFRATFPDDLTCSTRYFELPAEGVVEIETDAPPGCRSAQECPRDQMCLSGRCTSSCLPNEIPELSGGWSVEIGEPDNAGFFTQQDLGTVKRFQGAGTVATKRYTAGTTNLTVRRVVDGQDYDASLYCTLPGGRPLPLKVGDEIELLMTVHTSRDRSLARGLVIRQAGSLVLAADNGYGGPALDPADLTPFAVNPGGELFACDAEECGRRSHHRMHFSAGNLAADLEPGKTADLAVGEETYEAICVADYTDEVDGCGPSPMTPYVILVQSGTSPEP